jgi:cytochrome b
VVEGAKDTKKLLWDWPTRIFHWVFAGLFTGAFTVATLASEHSKAFLIHMVLGLVLPAAVLLRLVWGFVGSRPSRLTAFLFSPVALFRYLQQAVKGEDQPTSGHNPGSSYAIYAMLLLTLGLAATGIAQGQGLKWTEEVHQVFAYSMVGVIVLHVLGLARHTLQHRENIAMSMVDGKRRIPEASAILSARPWAGLAFVCMLSAWTALLIGGLDTQRRQISLPGLGTALKLGELENENRGRPAERHSDDD